MHGTWQTCLICQQTMRQSEIVLDNGIDTTVKEAMEMSN